MSADWMPSFAAVSRSAFLPKRMWPYDMDSGLTVTVDLEDEPGLWFSYANSDVPVVTLPSVVFRMLRDLDVEAGHRVL